MDFLLFICSGALYKLYDDITDTYTDISALTLEIIKVLLVATITIIMIKNPDIALFFAVMSIMCYFVNQFDTDFWRGLAITPFLISLFHIPYFIQLSSWDIGIRIGLSILGIVIIYAEAKMIPEEMSPRKYGSRIGFLGIEAAGAYLAQQYGFEYLVPGFVFFIGYFLANLVFHFPTVYKQLYEKETSDEKPLDTADVLPT